MEFTGKVAIVTGGTGGIGQAMARAFAEKGATVCVADLDGAAVAGVAKELPNKSFGLALDVRRRESIDAVVRETVARAGGIDFLINNAGVFDSTPMLEASEQTFENVFSVNVRGMFFMMQAVARQMIAQKRGRAIVNTASIAGRVGHGISPVYCASKAAVISFTQSAAGTLIRYGINVNAIAPGPIKTPMWDEVEQGFQKQQNLSAADTIVASLPARRLGTPADLVGAALFLCSDAASYIVGQTWNIDGGSRME